MATLFHLLAKASSKKTGIIKIFYVVDGAK